MVKVRLRKGQHIWKVKLATVMFFQTVHRVSGLMLYNQSQRIDMLSGSIEGAIPYRNQGVASRLTYSYDDRYLIEGNCGYNGSENFSPGKRFGLFPAIALGWIISGEEFFKPITKVIDVFKLRGSYGTVGNDQNRSE